MQLLLIFKHMNDLKDSNFEGKDNSIEQTFIVGHQGVMNFFPYKEPAFIFNAQYHFTFMPFTFSLNLSLTLINRFFTLHLPLHSFCPKTLTWKNNRPPLSLVHRIRTCWPVHLSCRYCARQTTKVLWCNGQHRGL